MLGNVCILVTSEHQLFSLWKIKDNTKGRIALTKEEVPVIPPFHVNNGQKEKKIVAVQFKGVQSCIQYTLLVDHVISHLTSAADLDDQKQHCMCS